MVRTHPQFSAKTVANLLMDRDGPGLLPMKTPLTGVLWALAFVTLEAVQYVYFGGLFKRMSSFLFGFLVFAITMVIFIGWTAIKSPEQLGTAFKDPKTLIAVNISATLAWAAYLTSVQLIEPAIAYTIGAGIMPVAAYLAHRFGVPEGEPMRNRTEAAGIIILLCAIIYLAGVTISGGSGFVRGGKIVAASGVVLAIANGVLFTWMLIYCQRLDRAGVGAGAVFGLRLPLYVIVAGGMVAFGGAQHTEIPLQDIMGIVLIGLALTIPPLYALHRAVAHISPMIIGALTALGPFMILALQIIEGRVATSTATLIGLLIYGTGAAFCALGAVKASLNRAL
jgi:drug/metabolite transporter (DMT)-like permease